MLDQFKNHLEDYWYVKYYIKQELKGYVLCFFKYIMLMQNMALAVNYPSVFVIKKIIDLEDKIHF